MLATRKYGGKSTSPASAASSRTRTVQITRSFRRSASRRPIFSSIIKASARSVSASVMASRSPGQVLPAPDPEVPRFAVFVATPVGLSSTATRQRAFSGACNFDNGFRDDYTTVEAL